MNPFLSQEDMAAFSKEVISQLPEDEVKYQLGLSNDDPAEVETRNQEADATNLVEDALEQTKEEMTTNISHEEDNPFLTPKPSAVEDVSSEVAKPSNPLEVIVDDLKEVMDEHNVPQTQTEFGVTVELDEESKKVFDQDIQNVIKEDPEKYASLESIILCDERNVKTLHDILTDKLRTINEQ